MSVTPFPPDKFKKLLEEAKRRLDDELELQTLLARIDRAKWQAWVKEGFTESQALELLKLPFISVQARSVSRPECSGVHEGLRAEETSREQFRLHFQARRRLLDFCIRELEKERDTSLLKKLQLYRARVPDVPGGICSAIDACYDLSTRLAELFVSWPKAEGNSMYPVPYGGNSSLTRSYAYNSFYRNHDLWGDHEYGKNRRELLDYCIHKLEASLAE